MESSSKPNKKKHNNNIVQDKEDQDPEKIDNHSVPVMTCGKVSGSAAVSAADFAFLM